MLGVGVGLWFWLLAWCSCCMWFDCGCFGVGFEFVGLWLLDVDFALFGVCWVGLVCCFLVVCGDVGGFAFLWEWWGWLGLILLLVLLV